LIEDEYGTRWEVKAHDPARKLVSSLERLGFGYIVLPRKTLITGSLETPVFPDNVVRRIRLADCLTACKETA